MNGVLIAIAADVAAVALLALFAVHAVRRARRASAGVKTITGSFEDRLATVIPKKAARLILFEAHGWVALGRLLWRLRYHSGQTEFPYSSGLTLLMGVLLGLTVVETPVFAFLAALLIPWAWLKVVLIVLELYAVWFVASTWAGIITYPHAIRDQALHLRVGLLSGMVIPVQEIESAVPAQRHWAGFLGPLLQDAIAAFPVAGSTEIVLRLRQPAVVWRVIGRDALVTEVYVHADDYRRLLAMLNSAMAVA